MKTNDALAILELTQDHVTQADVKRAYRLASSKYHPDKATGSTEMKIGRAHV